MVGDMPARVVPGAGKFATEGASPYPFGAPGVLKSSISLLSTTPVDGDVTLDPNAVLTVREETGVLPLRSTTDGLRPGRIVQLVPPRTVRGDVQRGVVPRHRPKARVELGESMSASARTTHGFVGPLRLRIPEFDIRA